MSNTNSLSPIPELSGAATDVLHQLFINGPTWDGDISSKSGRGDLFNWNYAERYDGWTFLTPSGIKLALQLGLDRVKEKRQREVSDALHEYRQNPSSVAVDAERKRIVQELIHAASAYLPDQEDSEGLLEMGRFILSGKRFDEWVASTTLKGGK